MNVTYSDIIAANRHGLDHQNDGNYRSYYTAMLMRAVQLGAGGIDLSKQPIVSGYRYGNVPFGGISVNYRDECSEWGCSMAAVDGAKEVGSSMFFTDRKKVSVKGILVPMKGSDGEALIMVIDTVENFDC